MAMGVPVAATSVSAIPELVEPGATGLLAPPGRPEELADAMQTLLTDEGLRRRIIPAARERVLRDFDNRRLVGRLAAIYREALGRQPSDPPA
jgi:glycosyltransferase involved in cell wall biosynthesis